MSAELDIETLLNQYNYYQQNFKLYYYEPYDYQRKVHHARGYRTDDLATDRAVVAANKIGKAGSCDSKVQTPVGPVSLGDIVVGDSVFGWDGTLRRVVGVFDQGVKDIYRLHFDDDATTECTEDHLWWYMPPAHRWEFRNSHGKRDRNKKFRKWTVGSLKEIISIGGLSPSNTRRCVVPTCSPVRYPRKNIPIDPYTLGALIGDGCFSSSALGFTSIDEELVGNLIFPDYVSLKGSEPQYLLQGKEKKKFIAILEDLGLFGKRSWEKIIPDIYKRNDTQSRLALLRGLMDTDGSVYGKRTVEYVTTSSQLAVDVKELVLSLGGKVRIHPKKKTYTYKGKKRTGRLAYSVYIETEFNPFFLSRKANKWRPKKREPNRVLKKIEYIGKKEARCIAVDHPDSTYLCDDFIVTHNTYSCAMEIAMHATGLYPDWWEGHRFPHRVEIMCGSESNELTRDVAQRELFGDPEDKDALGTGAIPKDYLGKITRKAGVPNAIDSALVKNIFGGWSRIFFRAYEQGAKKHQGFHIHVGWLDEEPPRVIKSQYKRATLNTRGILLLSFTPESGMTEVCNEYFNDPKIGQALIQATWDDCPLFDDPVYKQTVLDQFPAHEREMRSRGIPQMGSGLVFTTPDEEIAVPAFEIPKHWLRIKAVDFGSDHPFAAVAMAFDPDTEVAYVYWCHRKTRQSIAEEAAAINSFDSWIPVAWPHDGMKQDKESGKPMADLYRESPYNVNMLPQCFSNPPSLGLKEGQGKQGVEVGLIAIDEAMNDGKFKVFDHLEEWFEEKRTYHRVDGKVIDVRDDLMAATRYAYQSRRFAQREVVYTRKRKQPKGMKNW